MDHSPHCYAVLRLSQYHFLFADTNQTWEILTIFRYLLDAILHQISNYGENKGRRPLKPCIGSGRRFIALWQNTSFILGSEMTAGLWSVRNAPNAARL